MMGAFAEAAEAFGAHGIAIIPTDPDSPSTPIVKHPDAFGLRAAKILAKQSRFDDANAAVVCGAASGLTVVDIDSADDRDVEEVARRFGQTHRVWTPASILPAQWRTSDHQGTR